MAVTAIKVIHIIVLVVYSICAIYFSIVSVANINTSSEEAIDITDNWKEGAIMDIAIAENCPADYEVAFNVTWPGTEKGCYCQEISTFNTTLFNVKKENTKSSCSKAQRDAGCIDVLPADKMLLDSWGKVNNTKQKLCLLRSKDNWADSAPQSGAECLDATMKKCGTNPQNTFCTKETRCPVNYVSVGNLTLPAGAAELAACLYRSECLVLSRDGSDIRLLRFKRADAEDALPLSQLRLNEFSMCTETDHENVTPNRNEFWLIKDTKSTCNNSGNALWKTLNTRTEEEFFNINGLGPKIEYLSPFGYYEPGKTGKDYTWGVFQRSYIPWNISCRGEMSDIASKGTEIRTLKVAQIIQVIVAGIVNTILGLLLPIFMCIDKFPVFTKVFNWVGKLSLLPCQIICALIAGSIYTFFNSSIADYCSDPPIIAILRNFAVGAGVAYKSNIKGAVSSILAILFDIGNLIYQRTKGGQAGQAEPYYPQVNIEASLRTGEQRNK